ncbi:hypothetical protein PMAYCL1PPCAC_22700 [Pristionchus mayeri]|uniref:Uncharacterized protein n=1 Tax=Pristionchus mayeri TaxID=1317129 RepID=A0AAN5CXY2_9BILA|nr:hypothetical protein PMAYCL1PPCAC_22700 [Pristionchus mayeri]
MLLLVPARMSLALRRITNTPVSAAADATKRLESALKRSKKKVAAAVEPLAAPKLQPLQEMWELSSNQKQKMRKKKVEDCMNAADKGRLGSDNWLPTLIRILCSNNDFAFLEGDHRSELDKLDPQVEMVHALIWSAVHAKSLGALPPSVLNWIEDALKRLPETHPSKEETIIWLLSILRDDWPQLQQLQEESCSKNGKVGPEIKREGTLRYLALTYLQAGKKEEFRSVWSSFGISPVHLDDQQPTTALVHHAMMRSAEDGQSDPAMLQWYAESLVEYQRTPIEEEPQFKTMMEPLIRALGGKIEKWTDNDPRIERLSKWRDNYNDDELDKVTQSLRDYIEHLMIVEKQVTMPEDLHRLDRMLSRLREEAKGGERTIVINWMDLRNDATSRGGEWNEHMKSKKISEKFLPSFRLIAVTREWRSPEDKLTPPRPLESERVEVMELTSKSDKTPRVQLEPVQKLESCRSIIPKQLNGSIRRRRNWLSL